MGRAHKCASAPVFLNVRRYKMLTLALLTLVALPIVLDFTLRRGHTTGELTLARQPRR